MSSANLERLIEEVKGLPPDDLRRVRALIDSLLQAPGTATKKSLENQLDQMLLEAGVISEIPPPITDFAAYENRRRIEVKGKPVSETIIEERR